MPTDGLFIHHLKEELAPMLTGARINKIYQLSNNEFLFQLRVNRKKENLYVSLNPNSSRINRTTQEYYTPEVPPNLCMSLRKQIEGGIILSLNQHQCDRVLFLEIIHTNEVGDKSRKVLYLELMGRHSNLILTDENSFVIDALRYINNDQRIIMPKRLYLLPESKRKDPRDKLDLDHLDEYEGLSKQVKKELILSGNKEIIKQFQPTAIFGEKDDFYFFDLTHISGKRKEYPTLSSMLDDYYFRKDEKDRIKNQTQNLRRFIENELKKNTRKKENLEKDLKAATEADRYKMYGDLLYTYGYQIKLGDEAALVHDFEGNERLIPLDPLKKANENAAAYFKKYQKSKTAMIEIRKQIDNTLLEIEYFDSLLSMLQNATLKDALEIKEELSDLGYMKKSSQRGKIRRNKKPAFESYYSPDGTRILVGKNNLQNDYITFKEARPYDLWMHAKDMPGSHVIIKSDEISEETMRFAANLAAIYSKGKLSSSVPVDYTFAKNIKRIPNTKMGFVRIKDQKTIYIDPDETILKDLTK